MPPSTGPAYRSATPRNGPVNQCSVHGLRLVSRGVRVGRNCRLGGIGTESVVRKVAFQSRLRPFVGEPDRVIGTERVGGASPFADRVGSLCFKHALHRPVVGLAAPRGIRSTLDHRDHLVMAQTASRRRTSAVHGGRGTETPVDIMNVRSPRSCTAQQRVLGQNMAKTI